MNLSNLSDWTSLVVVTKKRLFIITDMIWPGELVPDNKKCVASAFGRDLLTDVSNEGTEVNQDDGFFIKAANYKREPKFKGSHVFFELGCIENSIDGANAFCDRNEDFGLLCEADDYFLWFTARLKASFSL